MPIKSPQEIKESVREELERANRLKWNEALAYIERHIKAAALKGESIIHLYRIEAPSYMSGRTPAADFKSYFDKRVEEDFGVPHITGLFEELRQAGYKVGIEAEGFRARHYYEVTKRRHLFRKSTYDYELECEGPSMTNSIWDLGKILPKSMAGDDPTRAVEKILKEEKNGLDTDFYCVVIRWD